MPKYILSRLANDNAYTIWAKPEGKGQLPKKKKRVLIKGGAGIADKRLVTPFGVVTKIEDQEYKTLLEECPSFKRHIEGGFIKVRDSNPSEKEITKISKDLPDDKSAPVTPEGLKSEGKKEGKSGKDTAKDTAL